MSPQCKGNATDPCCTFSSGKSEERAVASPSPRGRHEADGGFPCSCSRAFHDESAIEPVPWCAVPLSCSKMLFKLPKRLSAGPHNHSSLPSSGPWPAPELGAGTAGRALDPSPGPQNSACDDGCKNNIPDLWSLRMLGTRGVDYTCRMGSLGMPNVT